MEKFVVSRELAERLKAAGYPQQTHFCWYQYSHGGWGVTRAAAGQDFSAPMTDELLEQLPDFIASHYWLRFTPYKQINGTYLAEWMRFTGDKGVFYDGSLDSAVHGDTPANTLAEMWLLMRDSGYALPCGINQSKVSGDAE